MSSVSSAPSATSPRSPARRVAVVLIFVGSLLIIVAATRIWARIEVAGLAGMPPLTVSGRVAASSGIPIALASAAGAFVLITSARTIRFLVGLGLFLAGFFVAINSIMVSQDSAAQLANAMRDSLGLFTSRSNLGALAFGASFGQATSHLTVWPYVACAGGVLIALAGLVVMLRGWSWPGPVSRYERPVSSAPESSASVSSAPAASWDALSRGEDPT